MPPPESPQGSQNPTFLSRLATLLDEDQRHGRLRSLESPENPAVPVAASSLPDLQQPVPPPDVAAFSTPAPMAEGPGVRASDHDLQAASPGVWAEEIPEVSGSEWFPEREIEIGPGFWPSAMEWLRRLADRDRPRRDGSDLIDVLRATRRIDWRGIDWQRLNWRRIDWRKAAVGLLLLIIGGLGMVLRTEFASLPDNALDGAWLRARIELAPLLRQAESTVTIESSAPQVVEKALTRTKSRWTKSSKTRTAPKPTGAPEIAVEGHDAILVQGQVTPLKPLRVEVVDARGRRVFYPRPTGIHVDIADEADARASDAAQPGLPATVVLRAIIGKDGTLEHLYKVSGPPALTDEAMQIARGAHFGTYYDNGEPAEMEAILTITFPAGR